MTTLEIILLIITTLSVFGNLYLIAVVQKLRMYLQRAVHVAQESTAALEEINSSLKKYAAIAAIFLGLVIAKRMFGDDLEDDAP